MNDNIANKEHNINLHIPISGENAEPIILTIGPGDKYFILGPNGSGKSALVQHLVKSNPQKPIIRIAAHRQTWFNSSYVDLTALNRRNLGQQIMNIDRQDDSRWMDHHAPQRLSAALFDLNAAENKLNLVIANHARNKEIDAVLASAQDPSPLTKINELLQLGTLTAKLRITEDGVFMAQHDEGPEFNVAQMSDGERNAVLLAAQVLTAKSGTLFVIDEPERHLHRAIIEPLLNALFEKRDDCSFVIATHEVALPESTPSARVMLVRNCEWHNITASSWTIDLLEPSTDIPDDVKHAILGSRRRILFVEGTIQGLDLPLYSAIFPDVTVISKGGCREVIRAVKGLRAATDLHWVEAYGLIDGDDRSPAEINQLTEKGIFALSVHSVEALFYSALVRQKIAEIQAEIYGGDADDLKSNADAAALSALSNKDIKQRLAARRCEHRIRDKIIAEIPTWKKLLDGKNQEISITVPSPVDDEMAKIEDFQKAADLDALICRYPIRETGALSKFAKNLRFASRKDYEQAVVTLVQRDKSFKKQLQTMLEPIHICFEKN